MARSRGLAKRKRKNDSNEVEEVGEQIMVGPCRPCEELRFLFEFYEKPWESFKLTCIRIEYCRMVWIRTRVKAG